MSEITKEPSKQISIKCGIEPIFRYTYSFAGSTRTVESKSGFAAHINRLQHSDCMHSYKFIKVEKIFPDFQEPSNFVRLQKIIMKFEDSLGLCIRKFDTGFCWTSTKCDFAAVLDKPYENNIEAALLRWLLLRLDNELKQAIKAEFGVKDENN